MELINHTPFDQLLFRSSLDEDSTVVSIAVRVVFKQSGKQLAIMGSPKELLLNPGPSVTAYGPMESDLIFRRGGTDLHVYGHAYADQPGRSSKGKVSCYYNEQLRASLNVYGERRWQTSGGKNLMASQPKPFERIPLSLSHAYGGTADWDGLVVPCGSNSHGKGYYLARENALGNELPQLEFDQFSVDGWQDQPDPAGFGQFPMSCRFRFQRGASWNDDGTMKSLNPEYGNTAVPGMIIKSAKPGDRFRVTGASPTGDYAIVVPNFRLHAAISMGEKQSKADLYIDQIGVIPEEELFFITYRYHFLYKVRKMEKRLLEIKMN